MKRHIPNFITILNLLAGCLAIVAISRGELTAASWWIIAAAAFDLFDGLVARLMGTVSDIGKQLDSLADIVSFGVAPGYMLYVMIGNAIVVSQPDCVYGQYIPYVAFIVPAFAALRLAKFNIDTEQQYDFKGLPTPAAAFLILSFPIILNCDQMVITWLNNGLTNPWVLIGIALIISVLMVSRIPLFSLKFKSINWKYNRGRYIFIVAAIALFFVFNLRFASVPFIMLLYIILSLFKLNDAEEV
jgi:CDP-diacylglycerol--serine O-phosphatidyltransferase